ncbi:MAG TPA: hypothetical protein VJU78_20475 [Chitinophagaceae bacterium]|nr:hypothetical protein [Chitinophagaceae bacterium]
MKIVAYTLSATGFLGFIFFINCKGTAIPLKELWFVASICLFIAGIYFIVKQKLQTQHNISLHENKLSHHEQLRLTGDKIRLTLNDIEIKSRSYQNELVNDFPTQTEMLDALYDNSRNFKTEKVQLTYIVFHKKFGDKSFTFVSQPTSQTADGFRNYLDYNGGIDLYIDNSNPNRYFFDLPFH